MADDHALVGDADILGLNHVEGEVDWRRQLSGPVGPGLFHARSCPLSDICCCASDLERRILCAQQGCDGRRRPDDGGHGVCGLRVGKVEIADVIAVSTRSELPGAPN